MIVYEGTDGAKALDGSLSDLDAVGNYKGVTITDQGILSNDTTNASLVEISKIDGGYILQTASGYYLYSSTSDKLALDNSLEYSTAVQYLNAISIDNGSAKIKSNTTGKVMRFNNTSGERFRYFESGQKGPVQLYKLQE